MGKQFEEIQKQQVNNQLIKVGPSSNEEKLLK